MSACAASPIRNQDSVVGDQRQIASAIWPPPKRRSTISARRTASRPAIGIITNRISRMARVSRRANSASRPTAASRESDGSRTIAERDADDPDRDLEQREGDVEVGHRADGRASTRAP